MNKTNINIKIDSAIKKEAQELFSKFGLDMSTAINMFIRQSLIENGIPFKLKLDVPNAVTIAAMEEVDRMKDDPSLGKGYEDVDEMVRGLLK